MYVPVLYTTRPYTRAVHYPSRTPVMHMSVLLADGHAVCHVSFEAVERTPLGHSERHALAVPLKQDVSTRCTL